MADLTLPRPSTGRDGFEYPAYPAHSCVDQPHLSCPACLKWTGDGFATVKDNPEMFPQSINRPQSLESKVLNTSVRVTGGPNGRAA